MTTIADSAPSPLYRAVWRWHFYAGLIVAPFLILLAVTGGLYLFKPEIEALLYRDLLVIPSHQGAAQPMSAVIANVEGALDAKVLRVTTPDGANAALRFDVQMRSGEKRTAYADPYDARLLGTTPDGGIMQFIRKLHSLQFFGFWASLLIEIAAGWAIILVGTGIFLWWPRGRGGGVVSVRGSPGRRIFWRDFHAVTGAFIGVIIVFLAVTGMPWSKFWGDNVQKWATSQHLWRPAPPAGVNAHREHEGAEHAGMHRDATLPWPLQQAGAPPVHHMHDSGVDAILARLDALGLQKPFALTLPKHHGGAYVASYRPAQAERERTLYLDGDGRVLGDVGFNNYGAVAQAVEWGVIVHQGEEYGTINRLVMLAGCIAIVLLSVSSVVMWWKRRPKRTIGVPPRSPSAVARWGVLAIVLIVGAIYPLVGATILAAVAIDAAVIEHRMRLSN